LVKWRAQRYGHQPAICVSRHAWKFMQCLRLAETHRVVAAPWSCVKGHYAPIPKALFHVEHTALPAPFQLPAPCFPSASTIQPTAPAAGSQLLASSTEPPAPRFQLPASRSGLQLPASSSLASSSGSATPQHSAQLQLSASNSSVSFTFPWASAPDGTAFSRATRTHCERPAWSILRCFRPMAVSSWISGPVGAGTGLMRSVSADSCGVDVGAGIDRKAGRAKAWKPEAA
jgi:hypothetical protein